MKNKSQISFEYLMIMSFVILIVIIILGTAFLYSGSVEDRIKITQLENCANKIISTAEAVFYRGKPSKATINCYLPENVIDADIADNTVFFTISISSGNSEMGFSSKVPISGSLQAGSGLRKIEINALDNEVIITDITGS